MIGDLDDLMRFCEEHFRDCYAERDEMSPRLCLITTERMVVLPFGWHSPVERHFKIKRARALMQHPFVEAYMVLSEAWQSSTKGKPQPGEPGFIMPNQDPERREIAQALVVTRQGDQRCLFLEIKRNKKGKVVELVRQSDDFGPVEGDLVSMFDPPNVEAGHA